VTLKINNNNKKQADALGNIEELLFLLRYLSKSSQFICKKIACTQVL